MGVSEIMNAHISFEYFTLNFTIYMGGQGKNMTSDLPSPGSLRTMGMRNEEG